MLALEAANLTILELFVKCLGAQGRGREGPYPVTPKLQSVERKTGLDLSTF